MNKKRIGIINTGGTIGMELGPRGFEPAPDQLARQLADVSELRDPTMPEIELLQAHRVLDSSDMIPDDWQALAGQIAAEYDQYDGFVILHGTDTMAYTTSALAFVLRGLQKPIIFTGSQLPLGMRRNDARENLITALILASEYPIPEVCLYFGGRLLRGCRATKLSTTSFTAFESPNAPPLGLVGTGINVFANRFFQPPAEPFHVDPIRVQPVATFRLFPGVSSQVLDNAIRAPLQALVLESYGVGNGPSSAEFAAVLRQAVDRGVIVVNCSQCTHGCVAMDDYATGKALADAGVISGRDITIEAALTKLMYLFSQQLTVDQVRDRFQVNLAGEMSDSPN